MRIAGVVHVHTYWNKDEVEFIWRLTYVSLHMNMNKVCVYTQDYTSCHLMSPLEGVIRDVRITPSKGLIKWAKH